MKYQVHITAPTPQLWPDLFETEAEADKWASEQLWVDQWYTDMYPETPDDYGVILANMHEMKQVKIHLVTGEVLEGKINDPPIGPEDTSSVFRNFSSILRDAKQGVFDIYTYANGGKSHSVMPLRSILYIEFVLESETF